MSFDPVSAIADLIKTAVDKVIPDAGKAQEAKAKVDEMVAGGEIQALLGQLEINKTEAANPKLFVSGWRPFVGWTCGFALLYASILDPMARFVATVIMKYVGPFPVIDTTITMQVLFGMLGLGGMRMFEKVKGVAAK